MNLNASTTADTKPDDESRFQIHSRTEIGFILKGAMTGGEMVSTHFSGGRESFVTALLAVDVKQGYCIFDAAGDPAVNRRLCASDRVSFVSRHDKIKIRWEVSNVTAVTFEGRPALRSGLPETLLKFQRREFYRAETPVVRPVKCSIPQENGKVVVVNLFDISLGGVGLNGFPDGFDLDIGRDLPGCTITLPEIGVINVTLQIRNALEVPLRDGRMGRRAGCMFLRPPPGTETLVQRYIIRLERERRAKMA